ncbi:hypothetical protein EMIT0324P_220011 [Pseudomonas chlororaphis]
MMNVLKSRKHAGCDIKSPLSKLVTLDELPAPQLMNFNKFIVFAFIIAKTTLKF